MSDKEACSGSELRSVIKFLVAKGSKAVEIHRRTSTVLGATCFIKNKRKKDIKNQSCKSGRAFQVGFGPGLGLKLTKISGLIRAWDVLFVLGVQKNNQNILAILLNFLDLTRLSGFFGHDLGFKLIFGFGPGLVLWYRVRA